MITVRRTTAKDVAEIARAEAAYIDCPWNEKQIYDEVCNPSVIFLTAEDGKDFVGYISGTIAADECEISNIAVIERFRRRGAARALFIELEEILKESKISAVYLLVREGNIPATELYKKCGFNVCGRRPRYYKGCDALIMRKNL